MATGRFGVYKIKVDGILCKIGKADLNRVTKATGIPTRIHQQLTKLVKKYHEKVLAYYVKKCGKPTTLKAKCAETAALKTYFRATQKVPEGTIKSFFPEMYADLADLFT